MGSGSEEEEPTLYEELREERTTVDFEQRRQTWRQGIPATSFTRGYEETTPIETFFPENDRPTFDASSTMPRPGEAIDAVAEEQFTDRLSLPDALKFKDWDAARSRTGRVACTVADGHGRLPLLLALTGGAPVDVCLGILKANPQAATQSDANGNLPLHIAISRQLEIELIAALHEAHPKSSEARDEFGDLALHCALKQTRPVEPPDQAVEAAAPEPEEAPPWWATATTFVHSLASEKRVEATEQETASGLGNLTSLSQLVSAAQDDFKSKQSETTDDLKTDLLGAWKLDVVRMLLGSNPNAVVETCGNSKFTLDLATEARTAPEIMLVLLEQVAEHPEECARSHALTLDYPMHLALARSASPDLIARILASFPDVIHKRNLVGDLPIHVAKKHFAADEVVDSLMPVTPEATGVEKSRDPNARENKIKNFERGDLLAIDRAMMSQGPLPERRPMSPHAETREVGSPRAESTGRVISERDQYWLSHSVLSRTGSVKKVMGPEEEQLPKEEEERRMRVLAQTRLGSLPPYESEEERQKREKYERTKEKRINLDRFLQRHDPDPQRVINTMLAWASNPECHDAATLIQRQARGFLVRARGLDHYRRHRVEQSDHVAFVQKLSADSAPFATGEPSA